MEIYQGDARTPAFTITKNKGEVMDCTGKECRLIIAKQKTADIVKEIAITWVSIATGTGFFPLLHEDTKRGL